MGTSHERPAPSRGITAGARGQVLAIAAGVQKGLGMTESLVTAEVLKAVGKESAPKLAIEPVTTSEIRRWVVATLDDNPLWFDQSYAEDTRFGTDRAPGPFPMRAVGPHRHAMGATDPVRALGVDDDFRAEIDREGFASVHWPPGVGSYHAGNEVEYRAFARVGDRISMVEKIDRIEEKVGRSGPLALVYLDQVFTNQDGQVLMINHLVRIARAMPKADWTHRAASEDSEGGVS